MSANLEDPAVTTGLEKVLIPIPKKGSIKECPNHWTIAFISYASKAVLKILHARPQHYAKQELPNVQAGFRKGSKTGDQIANICWVIEKAREFQKYIYLCFINCAKGFDCVDHSKLWKTLKERGIPDHLTCLLRNLYAGQEATVRTLYGKLIGSRLRKEYDRAICCHPVCLIYLLSTSWETGLDELWAGIKIGRRNNSLRYENDGTLMAESEEELKSLLMRVEEESEQAGLKLNIKKN